MTAIVLHISSATEAWSTVDNKSAPGTDVYIQAILPQNPSPLPDDARVIRQIRNAIDAGVVLLI